MTRPVVATDPALLLDRLIDVLFLTDGLRRDLATEEAREIGWVAPELERTYAELDSLFRALAC